jgi:hypothetical protein
MAALIIAMANSVLQIIGTLWLLVVTLRHCNYRAVAAASAKLARALAKIMGCGSCCGPRVTNADAKQDVRHYQPAACTDKADVEGERCSARHAVLLITCVYLATCARRCESGHSQSLVTDPVMLPLTTAAT